MKRREKSSLNYLGLESDRLSVHLGYKRVSGEKRVTGS